MSASASLASPLEGVRPALARESAQFSAMAGRLVRRNLIGVLGVLVVVVLVVVALFADRLSPFEPNAQVGTRLTPPNAQYVLGLDQLGRDVLSRIIYGARVALEVSLTSVGVAVVVGGGASVVRGTGRAARPVPAPGRGDTAASAVLGPFGA